MSATQMLSSATPGLTAGLMLILLMVMFIALCIWAWSAKQKASFDQASRLPLHELDEMNSDSSERSLAKPAKPLEQHENSATPTSQSVILKHLYSTH